MNATSQSSAVTAHRPVVAPHGAFSLLLDVCRALAAFAVVLGHARNSFLVDFPAITAPSPVDRGVYFLAFGHEAVIIFFVLSGWLVGGTTLVQQRLGTFTAQSYVLQRVSRIWLVLVPSMLLGLGAYAIYTALGIAEPGPGELTAIVERSVGQTTATLFGPLTFLGNLLGLNTIVVPNYGGNGVLWSLSHEIVFYALVPFWGSAFTALLLRRARPVVIAIQLGLVAGVIVLLPEYHRFTLLLWTFGALLGAFLAQRVTLPRLGRGVKLMSWAPFAGTLLLARFGMLPPLLGDLLIALAFLLVLGVHRLGADRVAAAVAYSEGRVARGFRGLAAFSFSLYVLHPLVLRAVATITTGGERLEPGVRGYGLLGVSIVASLALSWAFAWATEARTQTVRRWLGGRLGWR